jgi:hypothetical protein
MRRNYTGFNMESWISAHALHRSIAVSLLHHHPSHHRIIARHQSCPFDAGASEECHTESPISCVEVYCGGCKAIFCSVTGNQVYTELHDGDTTTLPPSLLPSCASDSDCQDDEYWYLSYSRRLLLRRCREPHLPTNPHLAVVRE